MTSSSGERVALLVTGPNASGKTTTLTRAVEPYRWDTRVCVVYDDKTDRKIWKGDIDVIEDALTRYWRSAATVLIFEGVRMLPAFGRVCAREQSRTPQLFITHCSAETLCANIR